MNDKEFGQLMAILDKAIEVLKLLVQVLPILSSNPELVKTIVDALNKD